MPSRSRLKRKSKGSKTLSGLRRRLEERTPRTAASELQQPYHHIFQLAAIDHHVQHAVLQQELAPLKSFWQFLADRLLDDPRSGESNQRFRFSDIDVTEHRETRGDAAGRRIGQDRDIWHARAIQARERGAD